MGRDSKRCHSRNVGAVVILTGILLLAMTVEVSAQYQVRKPGGATKAASIQVTSPTGGETWEKGHRYEITWTSDGIRGGSVKIEFVDGNGKATVLVPQTLNSGKCSFSLSPKVGDGEYRVRVSTIDGKTAGETAGTVHVGKIADSSTTTKSTTTSGFQTKTYTPTAVKTPTVKTPTIPTASTPVVTSTTKPVSVAEQTTVAAPDVVRHDFTAAQVPVSELQMVDFPTIIPATTIQSTAPQMQILPSMIDVTAPAAGVAWQAGSSYTVRWASKDLDGPVKIDLIKAQKGTDGVVSYFTFPVAGSTENDGAYEYLVPQRLGYHSNFFVCEMSSLDGQVKDKSPEYFDVYTEPIDMTCQVVNLSLESHEDYYLFYYNENKWLEFDVWLRNNGTQQTVPWHTILVIIVKEPEEVVVAQEEWGFSDINRQLWYSTPEPRKFDISSDEGWPFYAEHEVDLTDGAYRVEVLVDPQNNLGENPVLRDDNKFVRHFEIN